MELKARLRAVFDVVTLARDPSGADSGKPSGYGCGFSQDEIDNAPPAKLEDLDDDE